MQSDASEWQVQQDDAVRGALARMQHHLLDGVLGLLTLLALVPAPKNLARAKHAVMILLLQAACRMVRVRIANEALASRE